MKQHVYLVKARLIWPILVARAKARQPPLSYGALSAEVDLPPRLARLPLARIQHYCRANGLPSLQALAVCARTNRPGPKYGGTNHERDLREVYAHAAEWPMEAPL